MAIILSDTDGTVALSKRQYQVLVLLRGGRSFSEVAAVMGVTRDCVKYHVGEARNKLGADNVVEAIHRMDRMRGLTAEWAIELMQRVGFGVGILGLMCVIISTSVAFAQTPAPTPATFSVQSVQDGIGVGSALGEYASIGVAFAVASALVYAGMRTIRRFIG